MSLPTWTRRAVETEAAPTRVRLWRAVEAQHVVATMALVDSADEQALLEDILEETKPPSPADCADLHYLLQTPFRYLAPVASRFRRAHEAGVWYGAERRETCLAELGYWRWRFVADSDGIDRLAPVAHTVFRAQARGTGIDLTRPPWLQTRVRWTAADDYSACHALAELARGAGIGILRYESVRDPQRSACAAVLDCTCFGGTSVIEQQSWFLTVTSSGVAWVRINPEPGSAAGPLSFTYA